MSLGALGKVFAYTPYIYELQFSEFCPKCYFVYLPSDPVVFCCCIIFIYHSSFLTYRWTSAHLRLSFWY